MIPYSDLYVDMDPTPNWFFQSSSLQFRHASVTASLTLLLANGKIHYDDVRMGAIPSQITSFMVILLNRLFRRRSKKTSKLRVTGLCAGNSPGTGEFPAQMAIYAENVSIWWRHHETSKFLITEYLWGEDNNDGSPDQIADYAENFGVEFAMFKYEVVEYVLAKIMYLANW